MQEHFKKKKCKHEWSIIIESQNDHLMNMSK
jgi:hypothetical protein